MSSNSRRYPVHASGPRLPLDVAASVLPRRDRVMGCFLGGAVGDALGAPVEFYNLSQIQAQFGVDGIGDYVPLHGTLGAITDDTQLTLFTAEALLRVRVQGSGYNSFYPPTILRNAYRRWLITQRHLGPAPEHLDTARGWLLDEPALWVERAPNATCLQALKKHVLGTPEDRINDGKGNGGVVRVAPAGLFPRDDPFRLGSEVAAITHGHPTGIVAAGFMAVIVAHLMHGTTLREAADAAIRRADPILGSGETTRMVRFAMQRADEVRYAGVRPTPQDVEGIGGGWLAHEALGIALFCAMCHPEPTVEAFERGVRLAVNHTGDSDSTGSMTGQLLGTMHGPDVIPARWLVGLELREVVERMADDVATEYRDDATWKAKYPPL